MNERIKELWEQSKTSGVHPEFGEYDKYSAEKFAELIVRECVKIAHNVALLRGVNDDMIFGADTAASKICQHFEIKY